MTNIDAVDLTLAIVMVSGVVALLVSEKTRISYVPLLIVLGIVVGPVLHIIERSVAHNLFTYVRVFGLVVILFAEGHNLTWSLLKKHRATIITLDTVGLLVTAVLAGLFFAVLFRMPLAVGFLFGAIISATDPATLIPLFNQHRIDRDIRSVIITESIFNDPLGIVLTGLAVAIIAPAAPSAQFIESIAKYTTLVPGAFIFFLYQLGVSAAIGVVLGMLGYWLITVFRLDHFPEAYSLTLAFGGFAVGEWAGASGYLVVTIMGMVLGNPKVFFGRRIPKVRHPEGVIRSELRFNEILSPLATVVIFLLLGASLDLSVLRPALLTGAAVALAVVFVARPVAGLTVLPLRKWTFREYLFISLEGPRGIVPSALSSLLLTLGVASNNDQLVTWGEAVLAATVITVLLSVLIETLWTGVLHRRLLGGTVAAPADGE